MGDYIDVSSHQDIAGVDLAAHWRAGYRQLMLKATEGTGYAWTRMGDWAQAWHSFGPDARVGYYHWLYGTLSGSDQARYFWAQVAPVFRPGDWTMTDFEDTDPSRWVSDSAHRAVLAQFDAAVSAHGQPHHVYAPNWYVAGMPITRAYLYGRDVVASNYSSGTPPPNPYGFRVVAHQYTDRATVAGMPRPVDCNRWLIPNPPAGTPTGPDQPSGDLMLDAPTLKQIADAVWLRALTRVDPATGKADSSPLSAAIWLTSLSADIAAVKIDPAVLAAAIAKDLAPAVSGFTLDELAARVKQTVLHLGD